MKEMRIILNEPQALFIVTAIEAILLLNREGVSKNQVLMGVRDIETTLKELKEKRPEVFDDMNKLQNYIIDWSKTIR